MNIKQAKQYFEIAHPRHFERAANKLINSDNYLMKQAVAEHGNDSHKDKLINDKAPYVRMAVAEHGNDKHREILSKEPRMKRILEYKAKNPTHAYEDFLCSSHT